jgi:ABC-type transporter Mla subunit MlaD
VIDPLFWLGLSIFLVAASLTAVLVAAIPALQELARAARSAEKLFDTISRELPPTLDAIRNTSLEISGLTDDVSEGVKNAGQVVKQVDQGIDTAKKQAQNVQINTRSVIVGVKAAWKSFTRPKPTKRTERLPMSDKPPLTIRDKNNRRTTSDGYRSNNSYSQANNWENEIDNEDLLSDSRLPKDWSE